MSWLLGHGKTAYTHHSSLIPLATKSGSKTTLLEIAQSSIAPCRLNPFLFNGHLQTMFTAWKDPGPPIYYKRHIYTSNHSVYPGTFAVDFVVSKEEGSAATADPELPERTTLYSQKEWENVGSNDTKPMLIALHGLTGGSHEVYLRETLAPLTAAGWEACVVNGRGCALSKITTPQLFNARATWDLRTTIKELQMLFPNRPLYAVGYSLGANILTNYCGEEGSNCVLRAAVANSNPWNLEVANVILNSTWLGINVYSRTMGRNLMGLYERQKEQILKSALIKKEVVEQCKYLWEFDRHVQCPTWGYPTEGAYYRDAQSVDALVAVRVPFLGINAEDDPVSSDSIDISPLSIIHAPWWLDWWLFSLLTILHRSPPKRPSPTKSSSRTRTRYSAPPTGAATWGPSS
jgi:predicted alpha/beta-fold hydrolase